MRGGILPLTRVRRRGAKSIGMTHAALRFTWIPASGSQQHHMPQIGTNSDHQHRALAVCFSVIGLAELPVQDQGVAGALSGMNFETYTPSPHDYNFIMTFTCSRILKKPSGDKWTGRTTTIWHHYHPGLQLAV